MRAALLMLALVACAAPSARMREASEVMAPLIGCWRGTFEAAPEMTDERCFSVLDGRHVVDTHAVNPGDYAGETTYHLDDSDGRIVFAYAANDGGRAHGELRAVTDGFDFPAHTFRTPDGAVIRMRARWTFDGEDRYVATSEREEGGAWRPFMRIAYVRSAPQ